MNKYNLNKVLFVMFAFLLLAIIAIPSKLLANSYTVSIVPNCTGTSGTSPQGVSCSSMTMIKFTNAIDTKQERIDVQKVLNKVLSPSPNLTTDGVFGTKTITAIKTFQTQHSLTADGKVGVLTRTALEQAQIDYYKTPTPTLSVDYLDPIAAAGGNTDYFIVTSNITWTISSYPSWVALSPTSGTGTKNIYVTVGANTGAARSGTITVTGSGLSASLGVSQLAGTTTDTTKPIVTAFTIPSTYATTSFPVSIPISTFTATDNSNTVTGYLLTETSTAPSYSLSTWKTTPPTSYSFSTAGQKTLYAWAKDGSNNVSLSKSATIVISQASQIDTTKPVISAFTIPATSSTLTVAISSFTASDNVGVTGYLVNESSTAPTPTATGWTATAPTSYTFTSTGTKTLYAWAKDAASNVSASKSATVTVSTPTPTLSVDYLDPIAAAGGNTDYFIVTSNITWTISSYPSWVALSPTSGTGTKNIYVTVGANTGAARSGTITVTGSGLSASLSVSQLAGTTTDTTKPTVTAFTIPSTYAATPPFPVSIPISTFTASDNIKVTGYLLTETSTAPSYSLSTWTSTPPTSYSFSSAGQKTLYAWAKDGSNNVSLSKSATIVISQASQIDTTKPVISAFTIPTTSTSLTVSISTFTATDNVGVTGYKLIETSTAPTATATGWTTTAPTSYTFTSTGTKTLYAWAKDAASNVSASKSATVTISTPTPTLSVDYLNTFAAAAGSNDYFNVTSNISWTVSTYPSWVTLSKTSGAGNGQVTVTATANTGAARSGTITLTGTGVASVSLSVVQLAGTTTSTLSVDYLDPYGATAGESQYFIVTSNISWTVSTYPSWVSVTPTTGTGTANVTVKTISTNTGTQRTGTITLTGTGVASVSLSVVQSAGTTTTCSNGATNYPTCTTNSGGACINGANNPPTCTTFPTGSAIKIFIIGDSSSSVYTSSQYPFEGWAMELQQYFNSNATVVDNALSGASTTSFLTTDQWSSTKSSIAAGNYLFIQFAGNDENANTPAATFKANLKIYVDYAKSKGAYPVLLTPVERNWWYSNGTLQLSHYDDATHTIYYPDLVTQLATAQSVPLLDMTTRTRTLYINAGQQTVTDTYTMNLHPKQYPNYPDGYGLYGPTGERESHYQATGANEVAKLVIQGIKDLGSSTGLTSYIKGTTTDITKPSITALSIPTTSSSLTVSISTFSASDNVGVTGYIVSESSTVPTTSSSWSSSVPTSYTFSSAGTKVLYAWVRDVAGNISNTVNSNQVTITITPVTGAYYVATNGSDSNPGTMASPWATWQKGFNSISPGNTLYIRGGNYYPSSLSSAGSFSAAVLVNGKKGTSSSMYNVFAYPGETPVLDGSNLSPSGETIGVLLYNSDYWHLKGLNITKIRQTSSSNSGQGLMVNNGQNNIIENSSAYNNGGPGFGTRVGVNNTQFLNDDSYSNYDPYSGIPGDNADGFDIGFSKGDAIVKLTGCRAWNNSDDGFDMYQDPTYSGIYYLTNDWSWHNGYRSDGTQGGDGNGFKYGKDTQTYNGVTKRYTYNSIAYNNRQRGFSQESADVKKEFYNNTAYANGTWGFSFYGLNIPDILKNNISYGNSDGTIEQIGSRTSSNNTWDSGFAVSSADFANLSSSSQLANARQSDGSLPIISFLHLASSSGLINKGVNVGLSYVGSAPDLGAFEVGGVLGASAYNFTLNMKYGAKGNEVTELQKALVKGGYLTATPNGNFGPATLGAVKVYQKANGLDSDGIIGPKTREILNKQ